MKRYRIREFSIIWWVIRIVLFITFCALFWLALYIAAIYGI